MSAFGDVEDFVKTANTLTRMGDLAALLTDAAAALGFDYVALVHHIHLNGHGRGADAVQVVHYPEAWHAVVNTQHYFRDDPVLAACERSATAFVWSDLPRLMPMTPRQVEILNASVVCGLAEGFTVPINVPGEFIGSCSFGLA